LELINNFDIGDIIKVEIGRSDAFCRILRYQDNYFGCRFINLSKEQYLNIIRFIYTDENGYYNIEDKQHLYKKLNSGGSTVIEKSTEENIFIDNKSILEINVSKQSKTVKELDNNEIVINIDLQSKKTTDLSKTINNNLSNEESNEESNNKSSTDIKYSDLSMDDMLKNVLKLDENQIIIMKIYNELQELQKEIEKSKDIE